MDPPPPGTLFLAEHTRIDLEKLAGLAVCADYILIGESHANPCDHQFQKEALTALAQAGLAPGLGLEMVPWSKQDVLDSFNAGKIPLEMLEERLGWHAYWGHPFDLYAKVLARAQALGVPLVALNVPRDLQNRIREVGLEDIPEDERGLLPPVIIPPPCAQTALLEEEYLRHVRMAHGHGQHKNFDRERFFLIQSLWDTQMAHTAITWRRAERRPLIILAGAGHVDHGHGIAHRLSILEHTPPRILSITPWRGGEGLSPSVADMFFYCPEVSPPRLGISIAWEEERAVITLVLPGSRAQSAGLLPGDVLLKANGEAVTELLVLHRAGKAAVTQNRPLVLELLRNDTALTLEVNFIP
jgi:uncharacterized iron-regulated protein